MKAGDRHGAGNGIPRSLYNGKGDLVGASADNTPVLIDGGTTNYGKRLTRDNSATSGVAWVPSHADIPTAMFATTTGRSGVPSIVTQAAPASGTLRCAGGIYLTAGQIVTNIHLHSGSTAEAGGTHCWFSLWDTAVAGTPFARLGVTADDTAAVAWAANTLKGLALASPYTVLVSGVYYLGWCVVAATVPTMIAASASALLTAQAPALAHNTSDTGLTDPASAPAVFTSSGSGIHVYGGVS